MRLSLAANYDADLIPQLRGYQVTEVYGKMPSDFVGGGRPSYMGSPITKKSLREYVSVLTTHGIKFNYLLNAACYGNEEWGRNWHRRLMSFLEELQDMGIGTVTVSTPFLLEIIKKRFPAFRVKVGIYAQTDTPRRARFWEELGADAINLESFSINRNFRLLAAIRKTVKCDLQLIANHVCLVNCALQPYHQNGFAHSSRGSKPLFVDYCFLRCSRARLLDPSALIKAQWIRPEDIVAYEDLGYTSFKLLERGIPSAELLRRAKAYAERRYEGNLADILLSYGFRQAPRKPGFWAFRHFFKPLQAGPLAMRSLYELARHQGMLFPAGEQAITIRSSAIPAGFIEAFKNRDCAALACEECRYCETIAAQAVHINPAYREEALRRLDGVHDALIDGRFWGVGCAGK
jgi:collagenase-like PrtC family protease